MPLILGVLVARPRSHRCLCRLRLRCVHRPCCAQCLRGPGRHFLVPFLVFVIVFALVLVLVRAAPVVFIVFVVFVPVALIVLVSLIALMIVNVGFELCLCSLVGRVLIVLPINL